MGTFTPLTCYSSASFPNDVLNADLFLYSYLLSGDWRRLAYSGANNMKEKKKRTWGSNSVLGRAS